MAFYGERGFPLEVNEPHHWGMRDAPDVIFVVSAYLSAYNARAFGVQDYIAQMMFNSPPGTSDAMDLAKMSAALTLSGELENDSFRIWRQTRTGLLSYPLETNAARAHLAASVYVQMALQPHILHVVAHTEAHHAATADDIIDACRMARRSIENALKGQPDMLKDPAIQQRKDELIREARITLTAIRNSAKNSDRDPFTDPEYLARAVSSGILDAPHLKNNPFAAGTIQTRIIDGACEVIDKEGWFHTGDIGKLIKGKFLAITDRKKEMFKLSNGKYIAPQSIENMFKESNFIEQLMVIGESEKFSSAIISPNFDFLHRWAHENKIHFRDNKDLVKENEVKSLYQKEVARFNKLIGKHEEIKRFRLVCEPWTSANGELSPTLKLRRRILYKKYAKIIREIYSYGVGEENRGAISF